MPIAFTRAPTVAPGDPVTSTQLATLARAFNDRLRSGIADPTFRIFFYLLNLFRQVRNPDATGFGFPAQAEFFEIYQHIDPAAATWPTTEPGLPEGANLANPIAAFVFGSAPIGLRSEDDRLTNPGGGGIPLELDTGPPATDPERWLLAKYQRGAFDPLTGALASPSFDAARAHYRIAYSHYAPHGNSYGGFLPLPAILTACSDSPPSINWEILFTKLTPGIACPAGATDTGATCKYPGTCPNISSHIAWISRAPWATYVGLVNGQIDILPAKDFLEGPYTGGAQLRKTSGEQIPRILNAFAREFRGSDTQRADPKYHLDYAFDFQRFLTSQYHLAPQRGRQIGDTIISDYPEFTLSGAANFPPGTTLTSTLDQSDNHPYHPATVCTGFLVTASKLAATAFIEALDADKRLQLIALTPDERGDFAKILWLHTPVTPNPLRFRLTSSAQFTSPAGSISIEATELYAYKPEIHDLYCLLRAAGADLTATHSDGRGIDQDAASQITADYHAHGCVTNLHQHLGLPGQTVPINTNAVFDAARRLSRCVRVIRRQQFIGYAVQNGVSVLWFKRYAYGLHGTTPADSFEAIAPNRQPIPSGQILEGQTYTVRTAPITYAGELHHPGATFTGLAAYTTFTGSGQIFEHEGIHHTALKSGLTNQWLLGLQLKNYHPSPSSIWKPDAYSDYFPLSNRCHFYSPYVGNKPDLRWHFNYGEPLSLAPEAPSGYNYIHDLNGLPYASTNFYKSCRVFEPDPEIQSAIVTIENGEEIVQLTLKSRLHHCDTAPVSINRDLASWDTAALQAEPYRTAENALREYLLNQATGKHCAGSAQPGNAAIQAAVWLLPDAPYGACYPHFILTQLIPEPYLDTNDTQDPHDTHITHDPILLMELYLRAICEGYIDTPTSVANGCASGVRALIDYTYENLCFDAFAGRWINTLATAQRPDRPQGFGPIPNIELRAQTFNQLSAAINKLTRARLPLTMHLQCMDTTFKTDKPIDAVDSDGAPLGACSTSAETHGYHIGRPDPGATLISSTAWSQCPDFTASRSAGVLNNACSGGGQWILQTIRGQAAFRTSLVDPNAVHAVPPAWRDMIDGTLIGATGILAYATLSTQTSTVQIVSEIDQSTDCCFVYQQPCPGFWHRQDGNYLKFTTTTTITHWCGAITSGVIDAPEIGSNVFTIGRTASGANCFSALTNTLTYEPYLTEGIYLEIPLL